jgi:glycosyltransferase involved in cell wall biosynthesis
MSVSAIVCAYNEQKTVKPILEVLLSHPKIDEVIAVDDGSTDRTGEIINSIKSDKLIKIHHPENLGKGAAVAAAVAAGRGDTLVFIDADVKKFNPRHIDLLLTPIEIDPKCMTIGLRQPHHFFEKTFGILIRSFGGERTLKKRYILPLLHRIRTSGYGIEIILNLKFLHPGHSIYYVPLPKLIHRIKWEKHPFYQYMAEYLRENTDILKQYFHPENRTLERFYKQIVKRLKI